MFCGKCGAQNTDDDRALRDMKNEVRLSMQLTHENIVCLHNFMESHLIAYLVMEYIDGQTLDQVLVEKGEFTAKERKERKEGKPHGYG